jgi:flagellar L-ring protein precursor FlgH
MKRVQTLLVAAVALATLAGCASSAQQHTKREKRVRKFELPCQPKTANHNEARGSIYAEGLGSGDALFIDQRAWRVCDVVMVNISERSSAAGSASTQVARSTEVNARIDAFLGLLSKLEDLNGRVDATNLVNAATDYTFQGQGSTRREGSLNAAVTVYVKQVLPHGNLYVEGSKTILVNHEEHYFYISGVIRQIDITPTNTIDSDFIGDAHVEFTGVGDVTQATEQGWLSQFFNWVWPF